MAETQITTEQNRSTFSLTTLFVFVTGIACLLPVVVNFPEFAPSLIAALIAILFLMSRLWHDSDVLLYAKWTRLIICFLGAAMLLIIASVIGAFMIFPAWIAIFLLAPFDEALPDIFVLPIGLLIFWSLMSGLTHTI